MLEFVNNSRKRKVKFLRRLTVFAIITLFPIVLVAIVIEQYVSMWVGVLSCLFLLGGVFLLSRDQMEFYLTILCLLFYPLLGIYPFIDQPVFTLILSPISLFLIVSYFNEQKPLHILNTVLFIGSMVLFMMMYYQVGDGFKDSIMYNLVCLLHSITIVVLAAYFTFQELKTSRREAENGMQFLRQMSDLNPHLLFVKNVDREFTFVNKALLDVMGLENKQIVGKKWEDLFGHFESAADVLATDQIVLREEKESTIKEEVIVDKKGGNRYLETIKTPIYGAKGELVGILGVSTDITEKRDAEIALSNSEKYYRSIFDLNRVGILTTREGPSFNDVNQAFCDLVGYSKEELQQMKITDVIYEEDYLKHLPTVEKYINREIEMCELEHRFWRKDGTLGYAMIRFSCFEDEQGKMVELLTTITDITPLKEIENALREKELFYRTLFETIPLGVLIVDTEVKKAPIDCNDYWPQLVERDKEVLLKGNIFTVGPEYQENGKSSKECLSDIMKEYRQHWELMQFEWTFQKSSGSTFLAEVIIAPMALHDQKLSLMIVRDITQKRAQEKIISENLDLLNAKNEELEKYIASNMQLENFAYLASHDLKSPIRTLISFSQLLERSAKEKLNKEEIEFLQFIVGASRDMKNLIEDLLTYSRVNTQNFSISEIELPKLIQSILRVMQVTIEEKQACIEINNLPAVIHADMTQMRQIFQNLIANAIKFVRADTVPTVWIEGKELANHWQFSVRDNGIGIEKDYQEQIFLLFRKLHGKGEYEGTGIGLSLCKSIAENHKGEIWLDSEYGKGTCFYFTISKNL